MRTISLTQGLVAFVDDEDFDRVSAFKWYAHWRPAGRTFYAVTNLGRRVAALMHQIILGFPLSSIDHKNGDTLDNRRCNLRLATQSQNNMNARLRKDNKSGLKGVSFDSRRGRWLAQIQAEGKKKNLGRFDTKEAAYEAFKKAAIELHGEFARF